MTYLAPLGELVSRARIVAGVEPAQECGSIQSLASEIEYERTQRIELVLGERHIHAALDARLGYLHVAAQQCHGISLVYVLGDHLTRLAQMAIAPRQLAANILVWLARIPFELHHQRQPALGYLHAIAND